MSLTVYINNTNLIELYHLRSVIEDVTLDQAEVTVTITDLDGNEVAGETWPLSMDPFTEDSPSQGNYRAVLSADIALEANTSYLAVVTADSGPGLHGQWVIKFVPRVRSS